MADVYDTLPCSLVVEALVRVSLVGLHRNGSHPCCGGGSYGERQTSEAYSACRREDMVDVDDQYISGRVWSYDTFRWRGTRNQEKEGESGSLIWNHWSII